MRDGSLLLPTNGLAAVRARGHASQVATLARLVGSRCVAHGRGVPPNGGQLLVGSAILYLSAVGTPFPSILRPPESILRGFRLVNYTTRHMFDDANVAVALGAIGSDNRRPVTRQHKCVLSCATLHLDATVPKRVRQKKGFLSWNLLRNYW
jgi:hypothetical protein